MSFQPTPPKKSNTGLWLGGAAILLVALIAVLVLLLNRQPAPAAPASVVIVSAATATSEPEAATLAAVDTPAPAPTETPTSTPMPELGTSNLFIEYILDASGSMSETLSDGSPKIEVAQQVLTDTKDDQMDARVEADAEGRIHVMWSTAGGRGVFHVFGTRQ